MNWYLENPQPAMGVKMGTKNFDKLPFRNTPQDYKSLSPPPSSDFMESSVDDQECFDIFSKLCGRHADVGCLETVPESKFATLFGSEIDFPLRSSPPCLSLAWLFGPRAEEKSSEESSSEDQDILRGVNSIYNPSLKVDSHKNNPIGDREVRKSDSIISRLCTGTSICVPDENKSEPISSTSSNELEPGNSFQSLIRWLCSPHDRHKIRGADEICNELSASDQFGLKSPGYERCSDLTSICSVTAPLKRSILSTPNAREHMDTVGNTKSHPSQGSSKSWNRKHVYRNIPISERTTKRLAMHKAISTYHSRQSDNKDTQQSDNTHQKADRSQQAAKSFCNLNNSKTDPMSEASKQKNFITLLKGYRGINNPENQSIGDCPQIVSSACSNSPRWKETTFMKTSCSKTTSKETFPKVRIDFPAQPSHSVSSWKSLVDYTRHVFSYI